MQAEPGWMSPPPWGQEAVLFPLAKIRFPSLQTASLSIMGHISSVLLIPMKRRIHFHWRKPPLFRHRPAGGPWPGHRQYSSRVSLLPYSSLLHTVWSLLANNGSIISRIVTKRDLLGQRIIKLFSLSFLFFSPLSPAPRASPCQSKIQTHFLKGTCTCLFQRSQQLTTAREPGPLSGGAQKSSKVASQHL